MGANGGGGSLGSDSAVCVRRYGRGRRESSHDPVLSSGLDTDDAKLPSANCCNAISRIHTLPSKYESRGSRWWSNLDRRCSPDQLSDNSGINYSEIWGPAKRKRAQNSLEQKVYTLFQCISKIWRWTNCWESHTFSVSRNKEEFFQCVARIKI